MRKARPSGTAEERDAALGEALRGAVENLAGEGEPGALEARALGLAKEAAGRRGARARSARRGVRFFGFPGPRLLAAAALAVVAASALSIPALVARRRAFDAGLAAAHAIMPEASTWVAEVFAAEFRPEGDVDEFVAGLWSSDGAGQAADDPWGGL